VNRNGRKRNWSLSLLQHYLRPHLEEKRKTVKIFVQISQHLGYIQRQNQTSASQTLLLRPRASMNTQEGTHKISTPLTECCVLTIILNVFFKHFKPQYAAHFSQCFQVIYMNNKRSENIIQCCTETFKVRPGVKCEN
jgi:hypothetical protein